MRKISAEKLKDILWRHKRWLDESEGWSEKDRADLREANLYRADLYEANLREADLREANLRGADLRGADLYGANLYEADLREADLREADLRRANLRGADLHRADLYGADLRGADLYGAKNIPVVPYACPDFGVFIGWKKASGYIVQLEIPDDAKRLSAAGRKCRCDKAKVLAIQNLDGTESGLQEVASTRDERFIYKIGKVVSVDNFDEDRWNECSTGIHFFINRQEAVDW